jgi:hypothetical protein
MADESALYALLVDMWKNNENGWGFPFRPEIVLARIETATRQNLATRTTPSDERMGIVGIIDGKDGRLVGSIGLFLEPAMWFTDPGTSLTELWVFLRPEARENHEADLRAFAHWAHDSMRADLEKQNYKLPFPLFTGFVHQGEHFEGMLRLWRRWGGRQVGALFRVD